MPGKGQRDLQKNLRLCSFLFQHQFRRPCIHADRLQFGWIVVKQGKDNEYKMSGEIYKWD